MDLLCDGFALDMPRIETNVFDFILDQPVATPKFGKEASLGSVATQMSKAEAFALNEKEQVGQCSDVSMSAIQKRNAKENRKGISVLDFLKQESSNKRCKLEELTNGQESFDRLPLSLTKV